MRIVVKIGSQVLLTKRGTLSQDAVGELSAQIAALREAGHEVVLVTSGAVASGRGFLTQKLSVQSPAEKNTAQQVLAAIGQPLLMQAYRMALIGHGVVTAQVLVTKEDFRTRRHFLNLREALLRMLDEGILPIANENDTISLRAAGFTDNDELARLLAAMLGADHLVILTSVRGLLDGDPASPEARIVPEVASPEEAERYLVRGTSAAGRGGMQSKLTSCIKAAKLGITAHIAPFAEQDVLVRILAGERIGTRFLPARRVSNKKAWIAESVDHAVGSIMLTRDAVPYFVGEAAAARSLLPIGIAGCEGEFAAGDIVRVLHPKGTVMAVGVANYAVDELRGYVGMKGCPPFIHYDALILV